MAGKKRPQTPALEWIASAVGLLLVLAVVAVIGREALNGESGQYPAIEVAAVSVAPAGAGFVVGFEAVNRSGGTAAAVEIEAVLKSGGAIVETSKATLDYVPAHSRRGGGLFFRADPRLHSLELRPLGFQIP